MLVVLFTEFVHHLLKLGERRGQVGGVRLRLSHDIAILIVLPHRYSVVVQDAEGASVVVVATLAGQLVGASADIYHFSV